MFTGIVQTKATVISFIETNGIYRLVLSMAKDYLEKLSLGASIAVNGCCLTVVAFEVHPNDVVGQVQFDIIDETIAKTNLGSLQRGSQVNIERSVTFGTEIGGHMVSGHIHCTGYLAERLEQQSNVAMFIEIPKKLLKYVLEKGFIGVEGCSLTVGEVNDIGFWLHLIPETLAITTLGDKTIGDKLNIEVDQQTVTIVETVERVLRQRSNGFV